jgi:menaquinone-specific isochorismate synthase
LYILIIAEKDLARYAGFFYLLVQMMLCSERSEYIQDFLECGTIMTCGENQLILGSGERLWKDKPEMQGTASFYAPDFFLSNPKPWFEHAQIKIMELDEIHSMLLEQEEVEDDLKVINWTTPQFIVFNQAFVNLQQKFADQELKKGVPYTFEQAQVRVTKARLIKSLISALKYGQRKSIHLYGFWDCKEGILGATPELLFKSNMSNHLETMACAGTRRRNSATKSLLKDPKQLHEHSLVVEGIIESLSPFGHVKTGELKEIDFPMLSHLITTITLELNTEFNFETLVKALHPTPALGAFPRKAGMEWLKSTQRLIDRKRFGAPLGFILGKEKQASCLVAIRNMQWREHHIQIGAGCGVVPESLLENEWEEIQLKIKAIKEILDL